MIKKELKEIVRSKKLLILVILFAFISISSPVLAKLLPSILKSMPQTPGIVITLPEPTAKDAVDQLVKNIAQIGMIVIIIMFAGSIADEKSKKTLEMVLTKPVSRTQFILAKFMASGLMTKIIYIVAMTVFYFYTVSLLGTLNVVNYLWLSLLLLIYILVILALTLFFSAISSSQIMAVGLAFLAEIVIATVSGYIKQLADYSPNYIVSHYTDLLSKGNISDFLPSALTSIALIAILIFLAINLFRRQEIER